MIFDDAAVVKSLTKTFLDDWKAAETAKLNKTEDTPTTKMAKKVAKAVVKDMGSVTPMIETAIQENWAARAWSLRLIPKSWRTV